MKSIILFSYAMTHMNMERMETHAFKTTKNTESSHKPLTDQNISFLSHCPN